MNSNINIVEVADIERDEAPSIPINQINRSEFISFWAYKIVLNANNLLFTLYIQYF